MAVRLRAYDHLVRDVGAAAWPVLDQDLLPPAFCEPFADKPGNHVSRPSGCERHDEADRTGRPSQGVYRIGRHGRHKRRCGSERVEMAASDDHEMRGLFIEPQSLTSGPLMI